MGKHGQRVSQGGMDQGLNGRIGKMLFRANDVRDLHLCVVNDGGKVVKERTITAHDDGVWHKGTIPFHVTSDSIVDRNLLVAGDQKPNDKRLAAGCQSFSFVR